MASLRRRRFQVLLATLLGAGAAICAGLVWRHRVELFVLPRLWHQVRELADLRETQPEHPGFQPTENRGLSPFEAAFSHLMRLQDPTFRGATDVQLLPMQSEEGRQVYAARYEPMDVPFDQPEGPDEPPEIVSFCNCAPYTLRALDSAGRLLGEEARGLVWYERSPYESFVVHAEPAGPSTLRLPDRVGCGRCRIPRETSLRILSIDRDGFVDHGFVTHDDLLAPVCGRSREGEGQQQDVDAARLSHLLSAARPGDLHRALSELRRAPQADAVKAEVLLAHPDASIRSRAVSVVGRDPSLAAAATPLLADPDPRVRFAAMEAASSQEGWEARLAPLVLDPNATVRLRAHRELACSTDRVVALRSRLELLQARDPYVLGLKHCGMTSEMLAGAALALCDSDDFCSVDPARTILTHVCTAFPPEQLRPLAGRLIRITEAHRARGEWWWPLARTLARLDLPEADAYLVASLCAGAGAAECACEATLSTWIVRETPVQAQQAIDRLEGTLDADESCPGRNSPEVKTAAALLLARHGSCAGVRWLARQRLSADGEADRPSWTLWEILSWIDRTYATYGADCDAQMAMGF